MSQRPQSPGGGHTLPPTLQTKPLCIHRGLGCKQQALGTVILWRRIYGKNSGNLQTRGKLGTSWGPAVARGQGPDTCRGLGLEAHGSSHGAQGRLWRCWIPWALPGAETWKRPHCGSPSRQPPRVLSRGRSCLGPGVTCVPWLISGMDPEPPRALVVADVAGLRLTVRTREDTPRHSW